MSHRADANAHLFRTLPPYAPYPDRPLRHIETGRVGGGATPLFARSERKGVVFDVRALPNPHRALLSEGAEWIAAFAARGERRGGTGYEAIEEWMLARMPRSQMADYNKLVDTAAALVHESTPVRFECTGGKHRSVVVAHAVARRCHFPIECVVHTEVPRVCERVCARACARKVEEAEPGPRKRSRTTERVQSDVASL